MSSAHELWPPARTVRVGATADGPLELAVHEAGDGPAVVLCHGFPDLAYGWRHQLPVLADAGFRAIAPDMRGYGGSSRPTAVEAYDLLDLTGDLVGLLDALDLERAVFVGHDWGGFVAWSMPLLHPQRCAGVVGVCTPYMSIAPTTAMLEAFGGDAEALYITWFQEPGVAEAVMDRQVRPILQAVLRGGVAPEGAPRDVTAGAGRGLRRPMNPFLEPGLEPGHEPPGAPVVGPEELDVYVSTFERTGFRGGINWYRNIDRNLELVPDLGRRPLELPCLQVCAEWDAALRPELADGKEELLSDYERHDIPAGHWVQQERPDALNGVLVDWLRRRFAP